MKYLNAALPALYTCMLLLLPRRFRDEFGQEMAEVFHQSMEACGQSLPAALMICWRELRDLPLLALREHWSAYWQKLESLLKNERNIPMSSPHETQPKNRYWNIAPRRTAWLAALPPAIFGVGGVLAISLNSLAVTITVWGACALAVVLGGLVALLKRLPDWGYTWMGSGLMVIAMVLKLAAEELDEVGRHIISPGGDFGLMLLILVAGLALLIAAARESWQPAGLVSIGFASIFGLSTVLLLQVAPFHRLDIALFALPAGLLYAAFIYIFMRGGEWARALMLTLVWGINAFIIYLTHITWVNRLAAQGRSTFFIPLLVFSTGFVLSGPFIGWVKKPVLRMFGRA